LRLSLTERGDLVWVGGWGIVAVDRASVEPVAIDGLALYFTLAMIVMEKPLGPPPAVHVTLPSALAPVSVIRAAAAAFHSPDARPASVRASFGMLKAETLMTPGTLKSTSTVVPPTPPPDIAFIASARACKIAFTVFPALVVRWASVRFGPPQPTSAVVATEMTAPARKNLRWGDGVADLVADLTR
jgi:hypothetical protein